MIVSSVSHAVARFFEPHSIYIKALADADLLTENRDDALLRALSVRVCINTEYTPLAPELSIPELRNTIESSPKADFFPVLNNDAQLLGIVHLEQITPIFFDPHFAQSMLVFDLMENPRWMLNEDDDLARAMDLLEKSRQEYLPVKYKNGKFMGFVSAREIFKLYRGLIREADSF